MSGTVTPAQSFDHQLQAVSGRSLMHELQIAASVKSGESWYRGALCSLYTSLGSDGKPTAIEGCSDSAMPLFALNGTDDFGVAADVGNGAGGVVNFIPGNSGMELFTTEFTDDTFNPNDFLTAGLSTEIGKVAPSPALYNNRAIVGQVSRGVIAVNGVDCLYFWAKAIPAHAAT